jgi:fimbrial chaperone protein
VPSQGEADAEFHMDECRVMHIWCRTQAAVVAAFFFFCAVIPGPLWAGSFQVTPLRVELSSQRPNDALQVQNNGSEPVVIQLQLVAWSQESGRDVYQPTDELLATPPIFTIQPGATQIIRVGSLRGVDEKNELSYRLFLQEVPSKPKPDFKGLQMALRIGLPVFILPKVKAAPALSWRVEQAAGGQLKVDLKNDGNAHIQILDFNLSLPDKQQAIAVQQVSAYLLPGQIRSWMLTTDPAQRRGGDTVRINAYTDAGSVETDIKLEKP